MVHLSVTPTISCMSLPHRAAACLCGPRGPEAACSSSLINMACCDNMGPLCLAEMKWNVINGASTHAELCVLTLVVLNPPIENPDTYMTEQSVAMWFFTLIQPSCLSVFLWEHLISHRQSLVNAESTVNCISKWSVSRKTTAWILCSNS